MPEFGLLQGLSVKNDTSQDIDNVLRLDQLRKQNEALMMAKNKMFFDDLHFQNGSNPYDAAIIKEENTATLTKLGDIRRQHPDWAYNNDVQGQMRLEKEGMKSTPAVLRSVAYKDAMDKYKTIFEDYAKNPGKYNMDDIEKIKTNIDNYNTYGHPEGQAGFKRDGGAKPLIFNPPTARKDLNELFKFADDIEPDQMVKLNNGMQGAYKMVLSEAALDKLAKTAYQSEPEQYKRFVEEGQNPIEAIKNGLRTRVKPIIYNGIQPDNWKEKMDYKAQLDAKVANSHPDIYQDMVLNKTSIPVNDSKLMQTTFGSTPTVTFKGPNGRAMEEAGNEFNYTRLSDADPKIKNGLKVADGFITKNLSFGLDNGVVRERHFWESGDQPYVVKPELADSYTIIYPPTGSDKQPVLQIKAQAVLDANSPEAKSKYNSAIKLTTDQRNQQGEGGSLLNEQREYQEDAQGNKYYKGIDY